MPWKLLKIRMRLASAVGFAMSLTVLSAASCFMVSAQEPPRPFIVAHYVHSYVLGAMSPSDPRVRNSAMLDDLKTWPPMSEESSWFTPTLSTTSSTGAQATQKDFENGERAGVDAFALLIGPKHLPSSQFSRALNLVASVAEHERIKLIPELWADPWSVDYKLYGQHVKQFMDEHPGAFQTWNGKPMFTFELDTLDKHFSPGDQNLGIQSISDFLAPWGGFAGAYVAFYVSWNAEEDVKSSLLAKADILTIWTPQDDWSALHSHIVVDVARKLGKPFIWPVSTAFYQRRAGGRPMEYGNGFGAAKYIDAWKAAFALRPRFVEIQTWNDFSEDSAVEPTNTADDTFLDLTRYFSTWANSGHAPPISNEEVMLFHPKQLVSAMLQDPTALVTNAAWRHKTPTVDYIDVVTMLSSAATARLSLAGKRWEQTIPSGLHEWVVYVPQQDAPFRLGEVKASVGSFPEESAQRSVTIAQGFSEGTPEIHLERDGRVVAHVESRAPYLARGPFQDFTLIGDESLVTR